MSAFEELEKKPREKRTAIEQCIIDAARLEDMRDGDYELMETAADELEVIKGGKDVIDKLKSKNESFKSQINSLNLENAILTERIVDLKEAIQQHFDTVQIPTSSLLPTEKALLDVLNNT